MPKLPLLCRWLGHRWRIVREIWPYNPAWYVQCVRCGKMTSTQQGDPFPLEDDHA